MDLNFKKITKELIPIFDIAGKESIDIYKRGLKIEIKKDGSPVSNGDLIVNEMITKKISELTPEIPIISEETVDLTKKNKNSIFWLIDPIDGTKEYISGKDEYTLNAALVIDKKPIIGFLSITKAAFNVYSSLPDIYSFVPSIGSINQKIEFLFFSFIFTVSSEIIGTSGVSSDIF